MCVCGGGGGGGGRSITNFSNGSQFSPVGN